MSGISIQECFFSSALQGGKHVTVYLLNGVKITGRVRSFDKYAVLLDSGAEEQLVFKHAVSAAFLCRNKDCQECFPPKSVSSPREAALAG